MGDIHEENSVSDGMRPGLKGNGSPHDFFPGSPDGISLEWTVDLKGLKCLV
jgi:hypothetical protein